MMPGYMYCTLFVYYVCMMQLSFVCAAIRMEMESLGVPDFKNLIFEDGIVDLSNTTVAFCKSVLTFVNEIFRFYTPELLQEFIDCFCDIFHNIVELYVDALRRDENTPMSESITGDAKFVIDTVLPAVAERINKHARVDTPELPELQRRQA